MKSMNVLRESIFSWVKEKDFLHPVNLWTNSNKRQIPIRVKWWHEVGVFHMGSVRLEDLDMWNVQGLPTCP